MKILKRYSKQLLEVKAYLGHTLYGLFLLLRVSSKIKNLIQSIIPCNSIPHQKVTYFEVALRFKNKQKMKETARTKTRRAAVNFQSLTGMRNQVCKCRLEDGFRIEREVAKKIPVSRCLTFNMAGDVFCGSKQGYSAEIPISFYGKGSAVTSSGQRASMDSKVRMSRQYWPTAKWIMNKLTECKNDLERLK